MQAKAEDQPMSNSLHSMVYVLSTAHCIIHNIPQLGGQLNHESNSTSTQLPHIPTTKHPPTAHMSSSFMIIQSHAGPVYSLVFLKGYYNIILYNCIIIITEVKNRIKSDEH